MLKFSFFAILCHFNKKPHINVGLLQQYQLFQLKVLSHIPFQEVLRKAL